MKAASKIIADRIFKLAFPFTEKLLAANYRHRVGRTKLERPIIVIGPDRSGTSLIYALLANHPEVYALTTAADRFPAHPLSASLVRRALSYGMEEDYRAVPNTIGGIEGGRFAVTEAIRYWAHHLGSHNGGWRRATDDSLTEKDLDQITHHKLPLDLRKRITVLKKTRLAIKQPGFSLKIRYLNALFPDAIFVHCLRHPLDNFHSLMAQKKEIGAGYWGVRIPGWQLLSHLTAEEQTARQLAGTYELIQQAVAHLDLPASRYLSVRHENLIADFVPEMEKLFVGCKLTVPAQILLQPENYVRRSGGRNKHKEPPSDPVARKILEKLAAEMGYVDKMAKI